jgi:flagellar biosynthesis protein FliP
VSAVAASLAALIVSATPLAAQDISINFGQGAAAGGLNERIIQLIALLTVLSPAPSILVMMTCACSWTCRGKRSAKDRRPVDARARSRLHDLRAQACFRDRVLLLLPFLMIDLVVASVLMSMGMMMLPPVVVSLPFKLIFFVLAAGGRRSPAL